MLKRLLRIIKKKWWYILLVIASTVFVVLNRQNINQLKSFNAINLIFIVWIILLLLPLFTEMEFFGVKLKREVEKAATEIRDLKQQIMNVSTNMSVSLYNNAPLPDERQVEKQVSELEKENINLNLHSEDLQNELDNVEDDNVFLFKARMVFERSLKDLCQKLDIKWIPNISRMLGYVNQREAVSGRFVDLSKQLIEITNRGVHGEVVPKDYVNFVRAGLPLLLKELDNTKEQIHDPNGFRYSI